MDWESAGKRFSRDADSAVLSNLRLLDCIGDAEATSSGSRSVALRPPPLSWSLRWVTLLAIVQISAALILAIAAPPIGKNVPPALVLATGLTFAVSAVILLRGGRFDRRTRPLAGFFLAVSAATSQFFLSQAVESSLVGTALRWISAFLPECFLPYFLWRFVEDFPRVFHLSRWSRLIRWMGRMSGAVGLALFATNALYRLPVPLGHAPGKWVESVLRDATGPYWLLLFLLALPALLVGTLRSWEADAEERRRLRLFLSGLALGVIPLFSIVLGEVISESFHRFIDQGWHRLAASFLVYPALLSIPVTTTYAVVAQRLLTVRLILHRAARLTLARGTLLALAAGPWSGLFFHFWHHRDEPLAAILMAPPAPAFLILAALGAGLFLLRKKILAGLELRLLGRRQASSKVLTAFHQQMTSARDHEELAALVREHARNLLQADGADFLVRHRQPEACLPADSALLPIGADSFLWKLIEASSEPLSVDSRDRDSLLPWLPQEERQWIAEREVRLMVPLTGSSGKQAGVLCFGPAHSGLVYSPEERQKAAALASATTLALERLEAGDGITSGPQSDHGPAGECRACGRVGPNPGVPCSCGRLLSPAVVPFLLAGKFRLEAILGEGGMGLVYRAMDGSLDRPVALKTLPRLGSNSLERLHREARSMARFVHPGLALIFGAETWRGVPVLVVEFLAGGTLDRRLGKGWEVAEALGLAADVADALVALHGQGLLHRDIKPSNIGFTAHGKPKLLDFGLAHLVEEAQIEAGALEDLAPGTSPAAGPRLTRTDHIVGTPLYLSPEALAGAPPSPAQDLWSLWLVLWETLAGHHPFQNRPLKIALGELRRGRIPDIRSCRPDSPAPLAEALARGLGRNAAKRLGTAEEMRRELLSLAQNLA